MRVKIIKCEYSTWWYADLVGQEYEVTDNGMADYHIVGNLPDAHNPLWKEDCQIVPSKFAVHKRKLYAASKNN